MMRKKIEILFLSILTLIFIISCPPQPVEPEEKPVIYLYPVKTQNISVKLNYNGKLICTYPEYNDGWDVRAYPDGKIINSKDNLEYSYLFWEGISQNKNWNIDKGFVVEGKDSKNFLQKILPSIGLIPEEYNEFIVYWLSRLEKNKFNLIYFAGEDYTKSAELKIEPQPDSILRVFMVCKPLDNYIKVTEQSFKKFKRTGFTVIEWGGLMLNK